MNNEQQHLPHHEDTSHYISPQPPEHLLVAHTPHKRHKFIVAGIVSGMIICILAVVGLLLLQTKKTEDSGTNITETAEQVEPSLTLYYRDGTTVLWQDDDTNTNSNTAQNEGDASHFGFAVKQELIELFTDAYYERGAWKVITTLDKQTQDWSIQALQSNYDKLVLNNKLMNGAVLVQDVTNGQVLAWVGGIKDKSGVLSDFDYAQFNFEVGTLARPLGLATLLENSTAYGAGSEVNDNKRPLEGWPCTNTELPRNGGNCLHNFDLRFAGSMPLRYAVGASRNVAYYGAVSTVPIETMQKTITSLGAKGGYNCYDDPAQTTVAKCYGAAYLGDGVYMTPKDTIAAYATLANNGTKYKQSLILRAELNGKTAYAWELQAPEQAIRADAAYIVNDVLSDPKASYFGPKDIFTVGSTKIALKTGVNNNNSVAHSVQYSSKYAVGVWLGTQSGEQFRSLSDTLSTPITKSIITNLHQTANVPNWVKPAGVQTKDAYVVKTNVSAATVVPSGATDVYPSWYKQ